MRNTNKRSPIIAGMVFVLAFWLTLPLPSLGGMENTVVKIFPQLGHPQGVRDIAFAPGGNMLVAADIHGIKFWDLITGREVRGFAGDFRCVAISLDGKLIAAGTGNTIRLWDAYSMTELQVLRGHEKDVESIVFLPGNRILASAGYDEHINLWDVKTGQELKKIAHPGYDHSVTVSPNGRVLASGSDKTIRLWDVESGQKIRELNGGGSLTISPDSRMLVGKSVTLERAIHIWDIATGQTLKSLTHPEYVNSVSFSPDGRYLAAGGMQGTIIYWDVATWKEHRALTTGIKFIEIGFSPDSHRLVWWSGNSLQIGFWDLRASRNLPPLQGLVHSLYKVGFSRDQRMVATAQSGKITLWDLAAGRLHRELLGPEGRIMDLGPLPLDPHGNLFAAGLDVATGRTITVKNVIRGVDLRAPEHTESVNSVAFSPDGKLAASGSSDFDRDKTIKLWDLATGRLLRTMVHTTSATGVVFSSDGRMLVSRDAHAFKVWDVASGQALHTLVDKNSLSFAHALSPDGKLLASGGNTGNIQIWNLTDGRKHRAWQGHKGHIQAMAFSHDGRVLVSGGGDSALRLWEIDTGRELSQLAGHTGTISSVGFSTDGHLLVSTATDGTSRIWDMSSGKELISLVHFYDGEWIAITPEGYFNASSPRGARHLNVRVGNKVYGIDQYYERFYRPDIVKLALAGKHLEGLSTVASIKPAPAVSIVDTPSQVSGDEVNIKIKVTDQGGGVGDVRIYINGSAVLLERARNLAVQAKPQAGQFFTHKLRLVPGRNVVRAVAFNAENSMQSMDVEHEIVARIATEERPALHALVVGIQEYENERLNLRYSVADAERFARILTEKGKPLFKSIHMTRLVTRPQTTKNAIIRELRSLRDRVRPQDLFVFFVASHGTVEEGEYFLVTSNVGSTSTARLKRDALSQEEIKELIANVPATKKLIVLDTCNAGKLGDALQVAMLTRGMSDDAAMKVLSRAVGSTVLSAATSTQEAMEGYQGHGIFTFVLTEGLAGKADRDKDGFVKTLELADYVDDEVPRLAELVFRRRQYPVVSPSGQGFPVVRVK